MNDLWYNPMMFPLPNNPNFAHTDTLIDGELIFVQPNPDQPVSKANISHLLLYLAFLYLYRF